MNPAVAIVIAWALCLAAVLVLAITSEEGDDQ